MNKIIIFIMGGLLAVLVFSQACSEQNGNVTGMFGSFVDDSDGGSSLSADGTPYLETFDGGSSGFITQPGSNAVQLIGYCNAAGGQVVANGDTLFEQTTTCIPLDKLPEHVQLILEQNGQGGNAGGGNGQTPGGGGQTGNGGNGGGGQGGNTLVGPIGTGTTPNGTNVGMGTTGPVGVELWVPGVYYTCTLTDALGNNTVTLEQINANGQLATVQIPVTVDTEPFMQFGLVSVAVPNSSTANVVLQCAAGANIVGTIYGNSVGPAGGWSCPASGQLPITVPLVPGLANTGQRVLNLRQQVSTGVQNVVAIDVDNTNPAHNCSIDSGLSNINFCTDIAGAVTGSCKAGLPVKLSVNGNLQHIVECSSNGGYVANNVLLLNNNGNNVIKIEQTSPFGTTCTAEKTIGKFEQLVN